MFVYYYGVCLVVFFQNLEKKLLGWTTILIIISINNNRLTQFFCGDGSIAVLIEQWEGLFELGDLFLC